MKQSEVNGLKSIVSILKSRLEKAADKGEEISCGLIGTEGYIEEESLGEALMGIDKMMTLYKELDKCLTDLDDCICDLEDAIDSAEITK